MDLEQLKLLCTKRETKTLEFKSSTANLRAVFETICAFLNSKGGIVLIGVRDDGRILGQHISDGTQKDIATEITKIEPPTCINVDYINIGANKFVIAIHVNAGAHAPYIYDGRAFQRDESKTNRMLQHRYEQLLVKRGQLDHSWDKLTAIDYGIDDLDSDEIYRTVMEGIAEKRVPASIAKESVIKILRQLNLIVDEKPSNAAVILFGKQIKSEYTQCWLKMARFKGANKSGDFIDSQQFHGNVFRMLEEADNFIRKHLLIASYFEPDQFKRTDKPTLPLLAVREALVNAICHKDYGDRSGYISIAIFDDSLEIWNNGTLLNKLKIEDLKRKHDSILRSELIAKVFYLRGYIEAWGTGTTKMVALCKEHAVPTPKFSERTSGFVVTFKFAKPMGINVVQKKQSLNARQESILQLLSKDISLTTNDIYTFLKIKASLRTVSADLSTLKKLGLVTQQGNGRGTTWKIALK